MPPLATCSAVQTALVARSPMLLWTSEATAVSLNNPGRNTAAASAFTASIGVGVDHASRGRVATSTVTANPSSRGARYANQRSEGSSARCVSSTAINSLWAVATFSASQYRPCSTANEVSAACTSTLWPRSSDRTAAAGPASSLARSSGGVCARCRSNSWRTAPKAKSVSSSEPRARRTVCPRSAAR